jgi:UDP-N-acetylglucosamine acyltransferase
MIHSTAIIHPNARLDPSVEIGPYAVVDAGVSLGPGCQVGPHVYLTGSASIGARNQFHASCVIGDAPQDLKYKGELTRVIIGDDNVFREGCTVHRSTTPDGATVIGSHNFLMANSHVGHNCVLGNHVILANGALLGGHVQVGDHVFISGNAVVHQFVRVGTLALMQGGAAISRDLPPFSIARCGYINGLCGLNIVGLRRAGLGAEARLELKRLYHLLFRSGKNISVALAETRQAFTSPTASTLLDFVASSKRGVCRHYARVAKGNNEAID